MNKKTKISLNSTLIETVVSKTMSIQEQYDQYLMTPDGAKEAGDMYRRLKETEKKCNACRAKALRLARMIVNGEWENWTEAYTDFYYKHEEKLCCSWVVGGMPERIAFVEDGEPPFCDKWWHCILPVIEIGILFIPGINILAALGASMAVGLADATIYYYEGERKTAGLVAFLTMLPLVPSIAKKFPFVKAWGKGSTTMTKFVNGKSVSVLEYYQMQSLKNSEKFIIKESEKYMVEKALKESVEIAGVRISKEALEKAMKDGYLKVTIKGVTHNLTNQTIKAITKGGLYTAKQQSNLIKFGKAATPYIIAGVAYITIYNEMAKTGMMGPQDLIRQLWGIEPRDTTDIKINKFFAKVADPDAVLPEYETNWDFIKTMFNASGSAKDGELMVQAIKNGWNPYEEGKGLVPKKYRTDGYKEWVENILSNEELINWFLSDGSEKDNELLLLWVFDNPDYEPGRPIDEKYYTETRKEVIQKEKEAAENPDRQRDEEGDNVITLPDGTILSESLLTNR